VNIHAYINNIQGFQGTPCKISLETFLNQGKTTLLMSKPLSRAEVGLEAVHQFALETRLKRAIEKEEFKLFYQPMVDLITGGCGDGSVAPLGSVRSRHDAPSEFIPVAEETGSSCRWENGS